MNTKSEADPESFVEKCEDPLFDELKVKESSQVDQPKFVHYEVDGQQVKLSLVDDILLDNVENDSYNEKVRQKQNFVAFDFNLFLVLGVFVQGAQSVYFVESFG